MPSPHKIVDELTSSIEWRAMMRFLDGLLELALELAKRILAAFLPVTRELRGADQVAMKGLPKAEVWGGQPGTEPKKADEAPKPSPDNDPRLPPWQQPHTPEQEERDRQAILSGEWFKRPEYLARARRPRRSSSTIVEPSRSVSVSLTPSPRLSPAYSPAVAGGPACAF